MKKMDYANLKEWIEKLKAANAGREDVYSVIGSLEYILSKPYDNNFTISKIRSEFRKLIEIDGIIKINYPPSTSTAGILYEDFTKEWVQDEFAASYPKIIGEVKSEPSVLSPHQEKRPVALLDVDGTLIIRDKTKNQEQLNQNLLDALMKKGIWDVYLFTDMYFDERQLQNRKQLIEQLTSQGFRVHGVITPSDYTWGIRKEIEQLNDLFVSKNIDIPNGRNTDKIDELLNDLPVLNALLENPSESPDLGRAFEEIATRESYQRQDAEDSINCKLALDIISLKRGTASPKTLMFEHFLKKKPDWVSDIFVFDDKKENLDAVKETLNGEHEDLQVSTLYVTENTSTADFEFEMDIDSNPENKTPLDAEIRGRIKAELDDYIQSRSTGGFWLFHNKQGLTEEKVKNARLLQKLIDSDDVKTVGDAKKLLHDIKSLNKITENEFGKTYLKGGGKFDALIDEFNSWLEHPDLSRSQVLL
ncbi:hypothetical protein HRQ65_00035 [Tatlockia micdadei]|nr:hypothetical protein [Legionella micdadei]